MRRFVSDIRIRFLTLLLLVTLMHSCNHKSKGKGEIIEGQVIYKISYPKEVNSHTMSFLFPKEMHLFFKDHKQRATFKGNMNLYSLDFIHLNKSDSFLTLLKVLDRKLYVPTSKSGDIFLFQNYSNEKVIFSKDKARSIAGYNCEMAEIKPTNKEFPNITIWYTDEIGIENPNRNTPFEQIPGVMLDFEVNYQNIAFHFKADKVISTEVSDDIFKVPETYSQSSISEIEEMIKGVLK